MSEPEKAPESNNCDFEVVDEVVGDEDEAQPDEANAESKDVDNDEEKADEHAEGTAANLQRVTDLLSVLENAPLPASFLKGGSKNVACGEGSEKKEDGEDDEAPEENIEDDDDDDAQSIPTSVDSEDDGPITHAIPKTEPKPKPKTLPDLNMDLQSVVDYLDVVEQVGLPEELLKKLADKKEEKLALATLPVPKKKVGKARCGPLSVKLAKQKEAVKEERVEEDSESLSNAGSSEMSDPMRPTIPRAGKGYWNLFRTADLINRALEGQIEGVAQTEPYKIYANSKARGRPQDSRGVITCRGRLAHPKPVRQAYQWLRTAPSTEAWSLNMKGPFVPRGPPSGRPFDSKNFSLPKMCDLSLGKFEEAGGPGVQLGFPVDHGWPQGAIEEWERRPMSLKLLEATGAELERLSNIQAVALETLFGGLKRFSDRHPELKDELEELQPTIQDIRDLDHLFANRAVVNFDLITKTSKKIVMDSMKVNKDTFSKYWSQPPTRNLFPDVSNVRNFRPVQPDLRAIEEAERMEEERRRREEEEEATTMQHDDSPPSRGNRRRGRPADFQQHGGGPEKRRRTSSPPRNYHDQPEDLFQRRDDRPHHDQAPPRGGYSPPRDYPSRDEDFRSHGGLQGGHHGREGRERGRGGRDGRHESRSMPEDDNYSNHRGDGRSGEQTGYYNQDHRGYAEEQSRDRHGGGLGGFGGDRYDDPTPSSSRGSTHSGSQRPERPPTGKILNQEVSRLLKVVTQFQFLPK